MTARYKILVNGGVFDTTRPMAVPPDRSSEAWQEYQDWLTAGNVPDPADPPSAPPPMSTQELQAVVVLATQARLDDFAKTRNYDNILSACTYATSTVAQFAAEGQYAATARDATWAALYAVLAEVLAGTRPVPAGFEDVAPLLPVLEWPA